MTELHIEVRVAGTVADSVLDELGDLRVVSERVETVLRGPVPDQAALVGMINRLQIWGVELKSFRQLAPDVFAPVVAPDVASPDAIAPGPDIPSGVAPGVVTPPDGRPTSRNGVFGAADPRHA